MHARSTLGLGTWYTASIGLCSICGLLGGQLGLVYCCTSRVWCVYLQYTTVFGLLIGHHSGLLLCCPFRVGFFIKPSTLVPLRFAIVYAEGGSSCVLTALSLLVPCLPSNPWLVNCNNSRPMACCCSVALSKVVLPGVSIGTFPVFNQWVNK